MVRENFCMLQKSAPLILQPRKIPLQSFKIGFISTTGQYYLKPDGQLKTKGKKDKRPVEYAGL